jgi:hypothetical protein
MTEQPEIVLSTSARAQLLEVDRAERELFMQQLIPALSTRARSVRSIAAVDDRYRVTDVLGYTVIFRDIEQEEARRYNITNGYMIASITPHQSS